MGNSKTTMMATPPLTSLITGKAECVNISLIGSLADKEREIKAVSWCIDELVSQDRFAT